MSAILVTNIKQLVGTRQETALLRGKDLATLPCIENAYLIIEDGIIVEYGETDLLGPTDKYDNIVDGADQFVLPCWCDSHTHLVFATSREEEFVDKINGMSYAEIAARGGGILNSARKIVAASETELLRSAWRRLQQVIQLGTGAIEIKSGYCLSVE